jgi:uncharacterized OB-fold protein
MTTSATSPFIGRPDPPVTPDTAEWWDATRSQRLLVQVCEDCRRAQFYPRSICTHCGGTALSLQPVSGYARVYSHTTVYRSPDPACFAAPYVVALVRLTEGPLMLTNIVGAGALGVRCDDALDLCWEALPDGRQLPLFAVTTHMRN